jgi:prophage regulatory protein
MRTKVLSFKDLRERGISYSRVHIHRLVGAGKFPRPIKIGANRTAWLERELDDWLDAKIAERDARKAVIDFQREPESRVARNTTDAGNRLPKTLTDRIGG